MRDHEHDGERSRDAVDAEAGHIRSAGDIAHDEGACRAAGQTGPEQQDILRPRRSELVGKALEKALVCLCDTGFAARRVRLLYNDN